MFIRGVVLCAVVSTVAPRGCEWVPGGGGHGGNAGTRNGSSGHAGAAGNASAGSSGQSSCTRDEQCSAGSTCVEGTCTPCGVTEVAVGNAHSCALRNDGSLWCWGRNNAHQLGLGSPSGCTDGPTGDACSEPQRVDETNDWTAVAAGSDHTCALRADGSLWCWGSNSWGQLGLGYDVWESDVPARVGQGANWQALALGGEHTCALQGDGSLWCWGVNASYQVYGGRDCLDTGCVVPRQVGTALDWTGAGLGYAHTCGLRSDGSLECWGDLPGGGGIRLAPEAVPGPTNWSAVVGRNARACGIRDDQTLWCWGSNSFGELGLGDPALCSDSLCLAPTQVVGNQAWAAVALGFTHSCAITASGALYCWGNNADGQLGLGDTQGRSAPAAIDVSVSWSKVAAGGAHSCAIGPQGALACWGSNTYGQLGLGKTSASPELRPVALGCPGP